MLTDGLLEPVVDPFRVDLWDGVDAANNQAEFRVSVFVDFKGAIELRNASCGKVGRLGCAFKANRCVRLWTAVYACSFRKFSQDFLVVPSVLFRHPAGQ